MSTGWVKSLYCKSNVLDDVYHPKKLLLPLTSCGASSQAIKDVVWLLPKHPPSSASRRPPPPEPQEKPKRRRPKSRSKSSKPTIPLPPPPPPAAAIPTLEELPEGHSSRRVVEIIFISSCSPAPFPAVIEMLFRVHNPPCTAARFEEYRAAVRSRSGGDARCAADGNEMMRFHCSSSASAGGAVYDAGVACCMVAGPEGKPVEAVRTFAGSGGAHESGGSGSGRRAMLVCRVIAGRIRSETEPWSESDSACAGPGELLAFDTRAVLPCFLIIYRV